VENWAKFVEKVRRQEERTEDNSADKRSQTQTTDNS
jgi:hypothetical protein